jgi:endonuclease III-like uncharacterized protein
LIPQRHGSLLILDETVDNYKGFKLDYKRMQIPFLKGINEPSIDGVFAFTHANQDYIALSYTSRGNDQEKVVILKENGL